MTEATAEPTPREQILATAAALGLTMETEFIPYSRSDNAKPGPGRDKPWPSLNWRVRLMRAGRLVLETPYSAGIGHTPAHKRKLESYVLKTAPYSPKVARDMLAEWEIEHGKAARFFLGGIGSEGRAAPLAPDLADVLSSLSLDSGVLESGTFEQWAREYGYDTDSRSAEATWKACLEIALQLRAAIGDAGLQALRDAAQDY